MVFGLIRSRGDILSLGLENLVGFPGFETSYIASGLEWTPRLELVRVIIIIIVTIDQSPRGDLLGLWSLVYEWELPLVY